MGKTLFTAKGAKGAKGEKKNNNNIHRGDAEDAEKDKTRKQFLLKTLSRLSRNQGDQYGHSLLVHKHLLPEEGLRKSPLPPGEGQGEGIKQDNCPILYPLIPAFSRWEKGYTVCSVFLIYFF
jgi:hypothetical protein